MEYNCPLCNSQCSVRGEELITITCDTCGIFKITREAYDDLPSAKELTKHLVKISSYTRNRTLQKLPPITLFLYDADSTNVTPRITIDDAIKSFPSISERLDKALLNLTLLSEYSGASIEVLHRDYPLFYPDSTELSAAMFIMQQLIDEGYINGAAGFRANLVVTTKGWKRISEIEKNTVNTNRAFTAMWFDDSMLSVFREFISKAVIDTGHDPFIISMKEHNDDINHHIIAEIRNSKFMIADFTGHRGGVYFEAGFAYGLGLPVIWTCRKDWFKNNISNQVEALTTEGEKVIIIQEENRNIHFDLEHYNFIIWENGEDLYDKLYNRIRATIV